MNKIVTCLKKIITQQQSKISPKLNRKENNNTRAVTLFWICALATVFITAEHQLAVTEKIHRFFVVLHTVLSEFKPTISKNVTDVRLLVWTRKSPLKYHPLSIGDLAGLSVSTYNRSNPTKILIHGFADAGLTSWVKKFKKHYLERFDVNVISVDWEALAKSPWYTTAAKNSK